MPTSHKQHRHFVVAPLLGLAVLVTVADMALWQQQTARLATQQYQGEGEVVQLQPSTKVRLEPSTSVTVSPTEMLLEQGGVLVQTTGLAQVNTAERSVFGLAGGFYVAQYGNGLSVAALTGPVLVVEGDKRALVPVGRQWRTDGPLPTLDAGLPLWNGARQTQALPPRFLEEKLRELSAVMVNEALPPPQSELLPAYATHAAQLLLPAARERLTDYNQQVALGVMHQRVMTGDRPGVSALLSDERLASLWETPKGQDLLIQLVTQETLEPKVLRATLLSALTNDSRLWLLASVHPQLNAATLTLTKPATNPQEQLLMLLSFPESDLQREPSGEVAMTQWAEAVAHYLQASSQSVAFLEQLIDRTRRTVQYMDEQGYPARARRYAQIVQRLSAPYTALFSADTQRHLAALQDIQQLDIAATVSDDTDEPDDLAAEETPAAVPALPPAEVEARAREILAEAGAMHTVHTKIRSVEPNTAEIHGVVFAGTSADRTFGFHLNVVHGQVHHLVEGSQSYPYAMWVEDFVKWAKR